ncbi:unnamed protein product [Cochlearia groenlandica]
MVDRVFKSYAEIKRGQNDWEKIEKLHVSREAMSEGKGFTSHLAYYDPGKKVIAKKRKCRDDFFTRELEFLKQVDQHQNLLGWTSVEVVKDETNYLLQDLWSFTLRELIDGLKEVSLPPLIKGTSLEAYLDKDDYLDKEVRRRRLMLKIIEDVGKGLKHLHGVNFYHRCLNPDNIVITCGKTSFDARIANFEVYYAVDDATMFLAKEQIENKKKRMMHNFDTCESVGQSSKKAVAENPETYSVDLYSFGLLIYYCMTGGGHPFGKEEHPILLEKSMLQGVPNLKDCVDAEASSLIKSLLSIQVDNRPIVSSVLNHPLFWSSKKRLEFYRVVSDGIEASDSRGTFHQSCLVLGRVMRQMTENVMDDDERYHFDWGSKLDPALYDHLNEANQTSGGGQTKARAYNFMRIDHLIRLIRNQYSHYTEMDKDIKLILMKESGCGSGTEDAEVVEKYYAKKFPHLLTQLHLFMLRARKTDVNFKCSSLAVQTEISASFIENDETDWCFAGSYGSTLRYKNIERMKPIGKHSLLGASGRSATSKRLCVILMSSRKNLLNDTMWDDGNSLGPKEVSMIGVSFEDNHVATGFGNHLARPILRDEWHEDLSFEEGVKLLEKCMRVLLYRDRSAINKLQIAKMTEEGVTVSEPYSLKTFCEFSAFTNPTVGAEGSW